MVAAEPHKQEPSHMTEAEYFEFEEKSEIKHEYSNGKVYAMAGAGWNHNLINGNTQTSLNSQLADKASAVVSSDMRLKVDSKSVSFRYPDTMVICGDPSFVDNRFDTVSNPTVIIEVLSPSTALKDHNEKLDEYIKIETVQDYVLISQHEAKVELYTRQAAGKWTYTQYKGMDANLELPSIACRLALSKLYEKVNFEQSGDS